MPMASLFESMVEEYGMELSRLEHCLICLRNLGQEFGCGFMKGS